MPLELKEAQKRICGLLNYIKEICAKVGEQKLEEDDEYPSQNLFLLPNNSHIELCPNNTDILIVTRPNETPCPAPSPKLLEWLKPSWKNIEAEAETEESKNYKDENDETKTIFFKDIPNLVTEFDSWVLKRKAWRDAERPVRKVLEVFTKLHKLKGILSNEFGRKQLYVTNAILSFKYQDGRTVRYPLLSQEVTLTLDSKGAQPRFIVSLSEEEDPQLNVSLLQNVADSSVSLNGILDDFMMAPVSPIDSSKVREYFNGLVCRIWPKGNFYSKEQNAPAPSETGIVIEELKLSIGEKQNNYLEQLDTYIKKIPFLKTEDLSLALYNVVGGHLDDNERTNSSLPQGPSENTKLPPLPIEKDYYLTKEYNTEQKRIIDTLDSEGCVCVQGPPGTGKSHTIANLLGHLLADNKTVLVTSYTSKALSVVKDKVAPKLRDLCVSVLDDKSRKELEASVEYINTILCETDEIKLGQKLTIQAAQRKNLLNDIHELKSRLENLYIKEYQEIEYQSNAITPLEAAQYINDHKEAVLIPGPFTTEYPLITSEEFTEVITTMNSLNVDDCRAFEDGIIDIEKIMTDDEYHTYCDHNQNLKKRVSQIPDYLQNILNESDIKIREEMKLKCEQIDKFAKSYLEPTHDEPSYKALKNLAEHAFERKEKKQLISQQLQKIKDKINEINELFISYMAATIKVDAQFKQSGEQFETFIDYLLKNKSKEKFSLNPINCLFNTNAKILKKYIRINDGEVKSIDDLKKVANYFLCNRLEKEIKMLIKNSFKYEFPEAIVSDYKINKKLNLFISRIEDIIKSATEWEFLKDFFNDFKLSYDDQNKIVKEKSYLRIIDILICQHYWEPLCTSIDLTHFSSMKHKHQEMISYLNAQERASALTSLLANEINNQSPDGYRIAYNLILNAHKAGQVISKLETLLSKTIKATPNFREHILNRKISVEQLERSDFETIWKASYLEWKINEINKDNADKLKNLLQKAEAELKHVNAEYILSKVQLNQLRRSDETKRQNLSVWLKTSKSITKSGKGVLDARKKREAREALKKCKEIVPIWIMPLNKVIENFQVGETLFDVMIVDEASQADIQFLPTLALAKKVIIVGDDKQVTPRGSFKSLQNIGQLMDTWLTNIPGAQNYDYKYSLYDIATTSFSKPIVLTEHFRCVPEIIQFCNDLSYDGKIKVLRDSATNPFPVAIDKYYVAGHMDNNSVNKTEAENIAALIKAMIMKDEYHDKTIGVITLHGHRQPIVIDNLLRRILTTQQYEEHNLMCGTPAQFQGDERDIIILSLVESPTSEGPLRKKSIDNETNKKDYNVAVSRAKNQLIIFHSMDPATHLQSDDIRLHLLKHAGDPRSLIEKFKSEIRNCESDFEERVQKDLVLHQYKFTPQYEVGAYRIDIVLEGKHGKIALECDGSKYHSSEEQIRNDLIRQSILERVGFTFVRIRGSDYYRKKEETMKLVFAQLDQLGAQKGYEEQSQMDKDTKQKEFLNNLYSSAKNILNDIQENEDKAD